MTIHIYDYIYILGLLIGITSTMMIYSLRKSKVARVLPTGIKDIKGHDIYEGDFLKISTYREYSIKKNDYYWKRMKRPLIGLITKEEGVLSMDCKASIAEQFRYIGQLDFSRGKIIGNKYENPELLKTHE